MDLIERKKDMAVDKYLPRLVELRYQDGQVHTITGPQRDETLEQFLVRMAEAILEIDEEHEDE